MLAISATRLINAIVSVQRVRIMTTNKTDKKIQNAIIVDE